MNFEAIEDIITERLISEFNDTSIHIAKFPNTQNEYKTGINKPVIWVAFKGVKYKNPYEDKPENFISISETIQDATMFIEVFYKSRKRNGNNGIFDLESKTRDILNNWSIPKTGGRMFPFDNSNLDLNDIRWMWSTIFGSKFISVPKYCKPESLPIGLTDGILTTENGNTATPLINRITHKNPCGDVVVEK